MARIERDRLPTTQITIAEILDLSSDLSPSERKDYSNILILECNHPREHNQRRCAECRVDINNEAVRLFQFNPNSLDTVPRLRPYTNAVREELARNR